VQDVGAGGERDVGPVVDGEQRAVPGGRRAEHIQRRQLGAGLQRPIRSLFAQLDDVDAAGECCVGELGEVIRSRRASVQR